MAAINYLTNLGDLAVLLPLSAVMLVWLLLWPRWDAACWWVWSVAFCGAATAILKIFYNACPEILSSNPSGHTGLSVLVYGAIALLVSVRNKKWQKIVLVSAGIALALGIAISRVLIGAHSIAEILIGIAIGAISLALFVFGFRRSVAAEFPSWFLVVPSLLVVLLLNGYHLQAEDIFQFLGIYLHKTGICG